MFNKKYFLILLLLIVGICAISAASAADAADAIASDNGTDVVAADEAADVIASDNGTDVVAADEANADEIVANVDEDLKKSAEESDDNEVIAALQDDSQLTKDQSSDTLSIAIWSPSHDQYKAWFRYSYMYYLKGSYKDKPIDVYVQPVNHRTYYYDYDFTMRIYDSVTKKGDTYIFGNKVWESERIQGEDLTAKTLKKITIPGKTLKSGVYVMALFNYVDNVLMSAPSNVNVTDTGVITASNYNSNYGSGAKTTIRLTDKATGTGIKGTIKATFSNGVVKYYTTDKNGYASFVPPVGAGTYTVTFSPSSSNLKADSVKRTVAIKKSKVYIKAKRVSEYKGFKMTLKAIVKSNGKNVNEGKVAFKINGKTYKVNVKNGVAVKKLKLKKVKKYRYSARYLGTNNLFKTGKSFAKAINKKRFSVKIYSPNPSLYVGQKKYCYIKVKTAGGKNVKNGWLKIQDSSGYTKAKVKNGKVKVIAYASLSDVYVKSQGDDSIYKKSVTKKFKIKYIPGSHKYKRASSVYKGTSKFKCHCGKTYTHSHSYMDYYYFIHYYTIYVIG